MSRRMFSFYPLIETDVHEMLSYETAKEMMRGVIKAQADAMKR